MYFFFAVLGRQLVIICKKLLQGRAATLATADMNNNFLHSSLISIDIADALPSFVSTSRKNSLQFFGEAVLSVFCPVT